MVRRSFFIAHSSTSNKKLGWIYFTFFSFVQHLLKKRNTTGGVFPVKLLLFTSLASCNRFFFAIRTNSILFFKPENKLTRNEKLNRENPERAQCNCSRPQIQLKKCFAVKWLGPEWKIFFFFFCLSKRENVHSKLPSFVIASPSTHTTTCNNCCSFSGALVYLTISSFRFTQSRYTQR